ncbi:MAG: hypothetical protein ACR5KW_02045 [Wolbachia sp.]
MINVNDNYKRNRTSLRITIGHKQLKIAKLLINNRENINEKINNYDKDDLTLMYLVILTDTLEFIE